MPCYGKNPNDATVRGCEGSLRRRAAAVPHGGLLRDVLRGREDRRARPGTDVDQPREGRKPDPDGRFSVPPAGQLSGQTHRRRLSGRGLRTGRRSQEGPGAGQTRSHAVGHARHPDRRCVARSPRVQLSGCRGFSRRPRKTRGGSSRLGLGRHFDRPVLRSGHFGGTTGRPAGEDRPVGMPGQRRFGGGGRAGGADVGAHQTSGLGVCLRRGAGRPDAAFRYGQPGRIRLYGRRPIGDSRRRGGAGLPARDAEIVARSHGPADTLSARQHPGDRRSDSPQPGIDADDPHRLARRFAAEPCSTVPPLRWARGSWAIGWPTR